MWPGGNAHCFAGMVQVLVVVLLLAELLPEGFDLQARRSGAKRAVGSRWGRDVFFALVLQVDDGLHSLSSEFC